MGKTTFSGRPGANQYLTCARLASMTSYALLLHPSANRVYADAAVDLTVAELDVFNATVLGRRLREPAPTMLSRTTAPGSTATES